MVSPPRGDIVEENESADRGLWLPSDLWVDAPDATREIERLEHAGEIDADTAGRLAHFVEHGYMSFPIDVCDRLPIDVCDRLPIDVCNREAIDGLNRDIERLWQERPHDLAYAYDSPAKRMSGADPATERRPRYRLHDPHSASKAALALYLNPSIFRHVELIYREPAVAIQSLYFEFGSQQLLHRDPVVVPTAPASHLLAAWISLEDIHPDSGPLLVVPGSHRLPYYEFSPGQFMFDSQRMGEAEADAAMDWDRRQCQAQGLQAKPFLGRKAEVLIWHHSLLHGGSEPIDERRTRKSLVVHFSTRSRYHQRAITLAESDEKDGESRQVIYRTRRKIERHGLVGFENPLMGSANGSDDSDDSDDSDGSSPERRA